MPVAIRYRLAEIWSISSKFRGGAPRGRALRPLAPSFGQSDFFGYPLFSVKRWGFVQAYMFVKSLNMLRKVANNSKTSCSLAGPGIQGDQCIVAMG